MHVDPCFSHTMKKRYKFTLLKLKVFLSGIFSLKSIYSFLVQNSFLGNSSINIIAWGSARFWTPGSDASLKYYHIDLFSLDNSMDRIVNIILYAQKFWVRTLEETCDPWYMWSRWWEEMRWPTKNNDKDKDNDKDFWTHLRTIKVWGHQGGYQGGY